MTNTIFQNIIPQFFRADEVIEAVPFGSGHINDTYKVQTGEAAFILQRVNRNVFDTAALVHNYNILNKAVEEYQAKNNIHLTPKMLTSHSGDYHFIDKAGFAWRKVALLPGSKSYDITNDTAVSYAAAKAYGKFQLFLNTLNAAQFQDTIRHFHHPESRMKQFEQARKNASAELLQKAAVEIEQVKQSQSVETEMSRLLNSGKLPRRLSHYDTKLNNVIFRDGRPFVIDLDTVMPGTILFDFGDMVRTFTSPVAEDEPDIERTIFRLDHFEALAQGYLGVLKDELTDIEKNKLLLGAKAIVYEQALRFLSDFLLGNRYYKIAYPDHNLVRCRTQLKLLAEISEKEHRAFTVIHNILTL